MSFDSLRGYRSYTDRRLGDTKDRIAIDSYFRAIRGIERHRRPYPQPELHWDLEQRKQYALGHINFAIFCAKRFGGPLEFPDAMQAAVLGLFRAAELYRIDGGASFGGYAFYWMRQQIFRARWSEVRLIRYPMHIEARILGVIKHMIQLEWRFRRPLTLNEYEDLLPEDKRPRKTIALMRRTIIHPDDLTLYDPETRSVETAWSRIEPVHDIPVDNDPERLQTVMAQGLDALKIVFDAAGGDKQLSAVLLFRLGLDADGVPRTLEETGERMNGISRERVRQIEDLLFRRARHPSRQKEYQHRYGGWFLLGSMSQLVDLVETMSEIDAQCDGAFRLAERIAVLVAEMKARVKLVASFKKGPNEVLGFKPSEIEKLVTSLSTFSRRDRRIWLDWVGWNPAAETTSMERLSWKYRISKRSIQQKLRTITWQLQPLEVSKVKNSVLRKTWLCIRTSYPALHQLVIALTQTEKRKKMSNSAC